MRRRLHAEVTVADLVEEGADAIEASCWRCGEEWQAPIAFLPPATTLVRISEILICPTCGGRDVELEYHARISNGSIH